MSARKYLNETGLASLWAKIVNKINDLGDLCVKKAGDTMSGALTIGSSTYNKCWVKIKNEHIHSQSAAPTNDILGGGLYSQDNENRANTHVSLNYNSDGNITSTLGTLRLIGDSPSIASYYNEIKLKIDGSGNESVEVTSPSAWRTALDAVSKSGDTMSGKLTAPSVDISGGEVGLKPNSSSSNDSADITFYYGNGQEKARLYTADNPTTAGDSRITFRSFASDGTPLQSSTKLATQADLGSYLNRGGYGAIASTDNLNNYNSTGTYWIGGTRPTNSPTPSVDLWGILEVYSYQSNIRLQRITQVGSTGIALNAKWVRFYINNAWQAWQKDNPYYEEANGQSQCVSAKNCDSINYIKCIRIGKQVTCNFHLSNSTEKTGELAWVALKSQFRPAQTLYFDVNIGGNSTALTNESAHRMYLYTDGTLKMWIDNTNAKVSQVFGALSYCLF